MAKMITLSFKDNEMDLYNYVKSKSSPSIYMKEMIVKEMNGCKIDTKRDDEKKENDDKKETRPNNINISALKRAGR